MHAHVQRAERAESRFNRRGLLLGAAGAMASAGLARSLAWPLAAEAATSEAAEASVLRSARLRVMPPPEPIPGGFQIPDGPLLHAFVPGPENLTFPFSGLQAQGLNVEPSTITDFNGVTALGYFVGTATGSDGRTYNLEADVRAFEGQYVAADESRRRGTFSFI